jgi:hypothetical protein
MIAIVVALSFLVLMIAFRSLLMPLDPVRPLDGLRGVPADPDQGALRRGRRCAQGGDRGPGLHRPGDYLGRPDHGFVFSSFLLNGDPVVKQFGVGLAVAIAIDATLVRCLLVPAVMVLLGESSWWLPRWLARALPKISIEGEEFFAERDTGRAKTPAPAP